MAQPQSKGVMFVPGQEPRLSNNVRGFAFDTPHGIYIPLVIAEKPGNGDVGKFLDRLPRHRRVIFPSVINAKLQGMLRRRGFVDGIEDGEFGEVLVMVRPPANDVVCSANREA